MCGFCGIRRLDRAAPPIDQRLLDQMTDSMAHRGPDDRGTWQDGNVALGHRRLSVIDLSSAGHQPMSNEDDSIHIAYNGEVYNFVDLRQRFDLDAHGHVFRSRTDTEVLIHLYEEIGLSMVEHLNGMFAMAIWDSRSSELHLIRDRYGIKPLFYQRDDHYFRFGSEIKAILQDPRVERRPSVQAMHDFLSLNYIPGHYTAFESIVELPPAHRLCLKLDGTIEQMRYWDLSFDVDPQMTEDDAAQKAYALLDQSVRRRLVADVPVGVLLSGGLDSSTVTALMHEHTSERIHTYSVGFDDPSFDELPFAAMVSKQFNTIHHEVIIRPEMVRDLLPQYLRYIDEPYGDGSAIPTYFVCQLARGEVVVVLSGEGGDEAFAGYDTYSAYRASQLFRRVPRWIRARIIAPIVNQLPVSHKKLSLEFKMKRFLGGLDLPPAEAHLWWRIVLSEHQKRTLYSQDVLDRLHSEPSDRHFVDVFRRSSAEDTLNRLLHIDSAVFLPDDLMIKNDRMSMAHSLEARVPFTDVELIEFMTSVPLSIKFRHGRKKHVMRRAMQNILSPDILNKKKVGLEMPYSRWFTNELRELLLHYCHPDRIERTRMFRPESVRELVDQHLDGHRDHGRALWGILNYLIWMDIYIS